MKNTLSLVLSAAGRKNLPCLLIGGNAVILLGFARNTIDIDLLVPEGRHSVWLDLMRELGFRLYRGTGAFAQFEPGGAGMVSVDLMFVDDHTWESLIGKSVEREIGGQAVRLPAPEHMVALKLHAASGRDRSKPEVDWEDIRQIIRSCHIDTAEPRFREMVLSYGGEEALRRIESLPS